MKIVPLTCTKCSAPFTHQRQESQKGANPRYCPECRRAHHVPALKYRRGEVEEAVQSPRW